jgi:beta-glucosidase
MNGINSERDCDIERPLRVLNAEDLTMKEKLILLSGASLWTTSGIPRLQIPRLTLSDGPHGVRKPLKELSLQESFPSTCFPTAAALACSWDEALLKEVGNALQKECVHYGVHILLGPGMNLKRHPGGGRNFEYFSEDPLLSGRLAKAYIQGVQSTGKVAACVKHFAVNNQESHRFVVDAVVDERTARELYYRGFEIVIKQPQPPATVMCAYNRLNGVFCSEHMELLTDILRGEWGFTGVTMTDWGATNQRVKGIAAGMDLEMPGSHGAHYWEIVDAVRDGELSMSAINTSVQRLLDLIQEYGTGANTCTNEYDEENEMWTQHYDLACKVAMDCCVLLKNDDNFLPLQADKISKVAVIGDFAKDHPRYQGMGSSQVHSIKVLTGYDELKRHIEDETRILFAPGYHADNDDTENVDTTLIQEAVDVAQAADAVLLFIGLPEIMESEGFDRTHLQLPAQHTALVEAVCNANPNVVAILSNGGAVEIPWFYHPKAVLEGYLLGEAGGGAVVDLIFGVQSPCGKLAETFPVHVEDVPANRWFPGTRHRVEYREGACVGYRYFDTAKKPVRYPFGHGLSYTTFSYSDLKLTTVQDDEHEKTVEVSLNLQNTGSMAGKEVVQCYVHDLVSSVFRPEQELKDFAKVSLEPGESQEVRFTLQKDAFSFYDIGIGDWIAEKGDFEIRVGSSSRDIRLRGTIVFETGPENASPEARSSYPPTENCEGEVDEVDDLTFANRFGERKSIVLRDILDAELPEDGVFHRNSLLKEVAMERCCIGKLLLYVVYRAAKEEVKKGPTERRQKRMVKENVENLPLRALVLFSRGGISFDTLDACISLMNLHQLSAIKGFCKAFYHFVRPKR